MKDSEPPAIVRQYTSFIFASSSYPGPEWSEFKLEPLVWKKIEIIFSLLFGLLLSIIGSLTVCERLGILEYVGEGWNTLYDLNSQVVITIVTIHVGILILALAMMW